jgi:hypothetical protein
MSNYDLDHHPLRTIPEERPPPGDDADDDGENLNMVYRLEDSDAAISDSE